MVVLDILDLEHFENDVHISQNLNAKNFLKKDKNKKTNIWGVCSLEDVKNNIQTNVKNIDDIKFIKDGDELYASQGNKLFLII